MRRVIRALAVLPVAVVAVAAAHQTATVSSTRSVVEALASERLEGRLAGSAGERLAADVIVSHLQKIGAKPLPGQTDYRMPFEFTAGTRDGGSTMTVNRNGIADATFTERRDVQALSFSDNAQVTGVVVFAGYGLVVPESQDVSYDSYATLDVKDKIVLVLRYFPEDTDQKTRASLARYADLRYKAMAARERGAKAMLVVAGPRSPNAGETIPMSFDTALAGSGIVAASLGGDVARAIFAAVPDKPIDAVQQSLDSGNPHVAGFAIPNLTVTIRAVVERERQTARNIAAYLPATTPTANIEKPWVIVGAHYDHLGRGRNGSSLARAEEAGAIHFGADDNASGSAAVLAVGAAFGRSPGRRNIVLTFWSGEEIGLLGSRAFATHPPIPIEQVAAYLNFDMVGRMQNNKLTVQAFGSSTAWPKLVEQGNAATGFDLQLQQDPYQPTDLSTFNLAGIPTLGFFTGVHADYHRPTDVAAKINYEDLDRIAEFGAAIARRLGDLEPAPQFVKVEQPAPTGGRAVVRVFTGTIPDYSADVKGLLLSGVAGGGPADQAGLQKGDVIIEIAGQSITNIYDYTYALESLKVGAAVKVVYMRGGERRETNLTPAARR